MLLPSLAFFYAEPISNGARRGALFCAGSEPPTSHGLASRT